ncbi:MAG: two-component system sensor histidine kinase CreC [Deltaproteobacteria bacterium]|nr:two-component system sensor histidine kinase CreC [Deltaproteobacteria bacterium]
MSIRWRIILGFAVIIALGFAYLFHWEVQDLEPQYRKTMEEPLVDAARMLAAIAAASQRNGRIDTALFENSFSLLKSQKFEAQVYDFLKTSVDLRVYLTDRYGKVIFDSSGRDLNADYSRWNDVSKTLRGEYGARTSHEDPAALSSIMYVAAPVLDGSDIIGVVSIGKPTIHANAFVQQTRSHLLFGIAATLLALFVIGSILARMLTQPIERLTQYARNVRDGKRPAAPQLGNGEVAELGKAFLEMKEALDGKKYIEEYVQSLTHEIKSPLSAIKGATELLSEELQPAQRARFLENIRSETGRIQGVVDRLLLLARIEALQQIAQPEPVLLHPVLTEIGESFSALLTQKNLKFGFSCDPDLTVRGDPFFLRHAFVNIVHNSIEFCGKGGSIEVAAKKAGNEILIEFKDDGAGIPEYALPRVFDRFYSLQRPDTGRKSSGLGLSLVREVVQLHGGRVWIARPQGPGTVICMAFNISRGAQ